ncbi:winged helix-turn-helix transcriptional regulator [Microbacterium sp. Clip185]|uniref:winged helix-turn-helix transcriptional regulator n=1 Tax=Microbacterium sp. Clip185 TaxID=3025663 RepID=UPI002367080F|nr:helix-turn-helix domain-containing protein [Microbacterium sp. Clip185]WDG19261.1 helix-turn-helix domain-containing protein [Microbacterium sp. Clip185]
MVTLTARERRTERKAQYDAFLASCPTRQLFATISDKWVGLVLVALADGPQRYNALTRAIAGISPKMLTQTLRTLERDGLVVRTVTASVPVRVDYELSGLGHDLLPLMISIKEWAEDHMDSVAQARAFFDASTEGA